jgi:peptidyl-prolyl cis-trans isomerase D
MITWMQRHKKYLVVTIWISVIAFVGAGFVGWGAYDFNSDRATAVAKVGDRKISVQDFQLAYANHYNFYNNLLGGKLTQEKADEIGLEKMVLKSLMEEASLLSYADELGLQALDSEVKAKLAADQAFQEKGVFNKEIYYNAIKRMGISANEYEKSLKKQILLEKLQSALQLPATKSEIELFYSAILMQDKLEVAEVTIDKNSIKISEDEAKKFWEENKNSYMSIKSYEIEYINVHPQDNTISEEELSAFFEENKHNYTDAEGKILKFEDAKESATKDFLLKNAKKEALKTYLAFKKGEIQAQDSKVVFDNDISFPVNELRGIAVGETLKPIEQGDAYLIVKINKINEPSPKSYEEAKNEVMQELYASKFEEELNKYAQTQVATFKGEDIGFVSRDSMVKILGMDEASSVDFINYIFDKKERVGYKISGEKALLYRVLEQKLLPSKQSDKYASLIEENVLQSKQAELNQNLIKKLTERYESEQYYKGK